MTPLALELLEDVYGRFWIPPKEAAVFGGPEQCVRWLRKLLSECQFFDCSSVWPLAHQLAQSLMQDFERHDRFNQRLAFLPSVITWIEVEYPSIRDVLQPEDRGNQLVKLNRQQVDAVAYTYRVAFIFVGPDNSTTLAQRYQLGYETPRKEHRTWRITRLPALPLVDSGLQPQRIKTYVSRSGEMQHYDEPRARVDDFVAYGFLSLINSPRIISQRNHFPYGRAEREALKKMPLVGKFPLRAWTEILLRVALPEDRSGEPSQEQHLTGEKCLHYCRTYLRIRHGMLEYVEGHWRGNPALGIKQSRYRLEKDR